jgi:uncharacterized iron-regulated protein
MIVKAPVTVLLSVLILLASMSVGAASDSIMRVFDGKRMSLCEAVSDLKKARLVFVGELHDEKSHHQAQLDVIRALNDAGAPVAIGLEMFQKDYQQQLDGWVSGNISEADFLPTYYHNWNLPWPLYRDIFHYAREHRIPMIGLNVSPEIVRQVARKGFGSLSTEQKGKIPPVTCVVDKNYREFIQRAFGAHAHGNLEFNNFCEAQLLWDASMASHLIEYAKENPDRMVVVLAGNGHAWKQGIPHQVEIRYAIPYRVILPEVAGKSEVATITGKEADYLWLR